MGNSIILPIVSSSNSAVSNSNQAKDIHFELFSQPNGGRLLAVLLAGLVLWAVLQLIVGGAVQLGYACLLYTSFCVLRNRDSALFLFPLTGSHVLMDLGLRFPSVSFQLRII